MSAARALRTTAEKVAEVRNLVDSIQVELCKGGRLPQPGETLEMNTFQLWHQLETIDDRLIDMHNLLGN